MPEYDDVIAELVNQMMGDESAPATDTADAAVEETQLEPAEEQSFDGTEPADDELELADVDDDGADSGALEVDSDTIIRLPDGREVSVKDGLELKADYTRKTQELAEQRRQVETAYQEMLGWRDAVVANPTDFVIELVQGKYADPAQLADKILTSTADPTAALAQVIQHMLDARSLSDEFVEALGLEQPTHNVRATAKDAETQQRMDKLERELAERKQAEIAAAEQQQLVASYERQIDDIIRLEGLDPRSRGELTVELVEFARQSGIVDNLEYAYAVLARNKEREARQAAEAAAQRTERKRAVRVMSPSGAAASSTPAPPAVYDSYESAAAASLSDLLARKQK